jgi:hypothetical protein
MNTIGPYLSQALQGAVFSCSKCICWVYGLLTETYKKIDSPGMPGGIYAEPVTRFSGIPDLHSLIKYPGACLSLPPPCLAQILDTIL